MIQRRQFIGSLAAVCTLPASNLFGIEGLVAPTPKRKLRWKCDVIQTRSYGYGQRAPVVTGVSLQPNRKLKIWDANNFQERATIYPHNFAIIDIEYSSDSKRLATVGFDSELRIYDLNGGTVERRLRCECPDNHAVAFSNDNQWIAAGGRSGAVRVWDVNSGRQVSEFKSHRQRVRSIQFTDDNRVVSCGDDQMVKITDVNNPNRPVTLPKHSSKLFAVQVLPNDRIATSGSDNMIHIWNLNGAEEIGVLQGHTGTVSSLDFAGTKVASGSFDTQVRIWHYQPGEDPLGRQTRKPENRKSNLFQ